MEKRKITSVLLKTYKEYLAEDEKSKATLEKYMRDIRYFAEFTADQQIDKTVILAYMAELEQNYAVASANSMIAALNSFLRFAGWYDLRIKQFRVQKKAYSSEEKELRKDEYKRLIQTAEKSRNKRLSLLIQTICATGIRVSFSISP